MQAGRDIPKVGTDLEWACRPEMLARQQWSLGKKIKGVLPPGGMEL